MNDRRIYVKGADLYSEPTDEHPEGGVLYRAQKRIEWRLKNGINTTEREKRNIIIGEVGEAAVYLDYKNRGFKVNHLSWGEFNQPHPNEGVVDIIASHKHIYHRVQVKSSENGNRAIRAWQLRNYERTDVNQLAFVALMEVLPTVEEKSKGELPYFICIITSQLQPRQIHNNCWWKLNADCWVHANNPEFILEWKEQQSRIGARQDLTVSDVGRINYQN